MGRPFDGLRIIDLTMFMSGPLVTLLAADLGAEVIKIESVQRLDGWRGGAGPTNGGAPPWEVSPSFNWINRNKRDITLNLTDPRGSDILKRLVAVSDVVIENYTPRVMGNFGLSYEELRRVKPDVIMLSMPGFGSDGPWRDYSAFAWSTEQMAGVSHITGYDDGPPLFTNTTGGDPLAGLMGAIALFSALHHWKKTGEGQYIDLSQLESSTWFTGDALIEAAFTGKSPIRRGNHQPDKAPHNTYQCVDGNWVAIVCRTDDDWVQLATLIGRPDWCRPGSEFVNLIGRQQGLNQLDLAIGRWTSTMSADAAMRVCQSIGVPAGAVLNGPRLLADPHLNARDFFLSLDRAWVGTKRYPGQPFRLSRAEPVEHKAAPLLGADTNEVLRSLLGIERDELRALVAADITGTFPLVHDHVDSTEG